MVQDSKFVIQTRSWRLEGLLQPPLGVPVHSTYGRNICIISESELLAVFEAAKILTQIMMNNPKIATFDEADQDSDKDSDDEQKGN